MLQRSFSVHELSRRIVHQYSCTHSASGAEVLFKRSASAAAMLALLAVLVLPFAPAAVASDWDGGSANWSSNVSPGWNATGVPNAIAAIANNVLGAAVNVVTAQDVAGGVTVGTLSLGGANDNSWQVTLTNPIIFNQDGGAAGFATLSNSDSNVGAVNALILGSAVSQTVTLNDDLHVVNTSASTAVNGAIQIIPKITGSGNLTFHSDAAIGTPSITSFPGAIRLQNGSTASTFLGSVLVEKGLVAYSGAASFGNALNVVTLGSAGMGDAALMPTASVSVANPIVVAAGAGTLTVGSPSDSSFSPFASTTTITLNGNLTIKSGTASLTATQTYAMPISGAGGITKTGSSIAALSGTNTYGGTTTVSQGTLHFVNEASLYNGVDTSWTATNITVQPLAALELSIGSAGQFSDAHVAQINALGSATGGFQPGSFLGLNPTVATYTYPNAITNSNGGANSVNLAKFGGNTLVTGAANTYSGPTLVLGGMLKFANRGALYSGNLASYTDANIIVAPATVAAFNVGGGGEFTVADIQQISSLGTATGGFLPGASGAVGGILGLDPTNAGVGGFDYPNALTDLNGGATRLGVRQVGTGTLILSGANTYTGQTIVNFGGTLKVTGSHTVTPATFNNETGSYLIASAAGTTGNVVLENATIVSNFGFMVGNSGTGTATMTGGSMQLKASNAGGGHFFGVGRNAGSTGTFTLNSGSIDVTNDWYVFGVTGTGHGTQNDGSVVANTFALGQAAAGVGDYTMHGGSISTTALVRPGIDGKGTIVQDGGTISCGNVFWLGEAATGEGTYTLSGAGSLTTVFNITAGINGKGTINQSGGTISSGTWFTMGENPTGNGTLNMSGGTFATATENFVLGYQGTGTVNQTLGDISVGVDWILGWTQAAATHSKGTYVMNGGTLSVARDGYVGIEGEGSLTQTNGTISIGGFFAVGRGLGAVPNNNTFTKSGGVFTVTGDFNVGDFGKGNLDMTGGSILTNTGFVVAYQASSTGVATINGATADVQANGTTGGIYIGLAGNGTLNMMQGTLSANDATGDLRIGNNAGSTGVLTQTGGAITISDQTYAGLSGNGTYNMDGGTLSAGDNLWVALNAGGTGLFKMTAGTVTVVGNDPSYTGNIVLARAGTLGTIDMQGGTINLAVPSTTGTNNSASESVGIDGTFAAAQDGNLIIGERSGSGVWTQSGGLVNIAANIFMNANVITGGTESGNTAVFTMTGGTTNVGTTSPTGGDIVLAHRAGTTATVNLQGGLLNVTNGSGIIGAGLGTAAFNFTGGTLKVNQFNNTVFGGDMLGLTQNGASSLLDVTGNDTQINGFYTLTAGTATVGATHLLNVTGPIAVGSGGTVAGSGSVVAPSVSVSPGGVFSPGTSPGTLSVQSNITFNGTLRTEIVGTNIDKLAVTGNLTLGAGSVLDIQGNLATATTHVIATVTGTLSGLFSDASDATTNGYNVVYEPNQIILDELDGDANHDGLVDIFDINLVSANWNPAGPVAAFAPGNINHDTVVDIFDINQISSNWAHVATNGGPAHAQAVPEPSTLVIALLGLAGVVGYRRCRRSRR